MNNLQLSASFRAGRLRLACATVCLLSWAAAGGVNGASSKRGLEIALGKQLFFDARLSADRKVSCASCHQPGKAFTDGRAVAIGTNGRAGTRNTPTLIGVAVSKSFFWDGRRESIAALVGDPWTNANEHGMASREAVAELVRSLPEYSAGAGLRFEEIARSVAAYIGTLNRPGDAPFDRYTRDGDRQALSESAKRGYEIFRGHGNCISCHDARDGFTDGRFHASLLSTGVSSRLSELTALVVSTPADSRAGLIANQQDVAALGRFVVTLDPRDIGRFRTPTLRNVALTAPYMHDGSAATLEEAVAREVYASSARSAGQVRLTPSELKDVVEFLKSLTGDSARRGEL